MVKQIKYFCEGLIRERITSQEEKMEINEWWVVIGSTQDTGVIEKFRKHFSLLLLIYILL